jgi:hypothetical protein
VGEGRVGVFLGFWWVFWVVFGVFLLGFDGVFFVVVVFGR